MGLAVHLLQAECDGRRLDGWTHRYTSGRDGKKHLLIEDLFWSLEEDDTEKFNPRESMTLTVKKGKKLNWTARCW